MTEKNVLKKNIKERIKKKRYEYKKPKKDDKLNTQLILNVFIALTILIGLVFSLLQIL